MPFWAHHRGEKVPLSAPVGELLYSGWCFSSARMALLRVAPYSSSTACSTVELMSSSGLPYFCISGYHMRYAERLSALRLLDRSVVGDGRVVH